MGLRQMRLLFSLFELSSEEKFTKDVLNQVTGYTSMAKRSWKIPGVNSPWELKPVTHVEDILQRMQLPLAPLQRGALQQKLFYLLFFWIPPLSRGVFYCFPEQWPKTGIKTDGLPFPSHYMSSHRTQNMMQKPKKAHLTLQLVRKL